MHISLAEQIDLRALVAEDAERLADYFAGLSAETRSRFQPHPLTSVVAARVCTEPDPATLRLVLSAVDGIIGYFVLETAVRTEDAMRYAGQGVALLSGRDFLFAPSIADAWQDRGLASLAMPHIMALAAAAGARSLVLMGGTQASNARAIRFYEKFGFLRCGGYQTDQWNHDMRLVIA